jgi:ATP-dependent RNA helicase DDX49/DBP8
MEDVAEPSIFSRKSLQQPVSRTVSKKEPTSAAFVESFLSESGEENNASFEGLGLAEWLVRTCRELGMKKPTPVQQGCVSQILAGKDVFGLAQTGSGKTAAFALPILQKLAENPYGVYALVLTPTRELAFQISDQFKALGSGMNLRNTVVIGGMDMTAQAKALMQRPHVVIATPGRMRDHLTNDPDIAAVFARTKVVCLSVNLSAITVSFSLKPHVRRTKLSNGSGSSKGI